MLRQIVTDLTAFPLTDGQYKILVRLRRLDKAIVDLAANKMELSQADLCRALIVNGSREILRQLGIAEPITPIKVQPDADPEADDSNESTI